MTANLSYSVDLLSLIEADWPACQSDTAGLHPNLHHPGPITAEKTSGDERMGGEGGEERGKERRKLP